MPESSAANVPSAWLLGNGCVQVRSMALKSNRCKHLLLKCSVTTWTQSMDYTAATRTAPDASKLAQLLRSQYRLAFA
eukprot:43915-Pleurochrysis_carterae.AAC.1